MLKDSKIQKFVKVHFAGTVFVGIVFVEVLFVVSIISSHMTTGSPVILPTYFTIFGATCYRIPKITLVTHNVLVDFYPHTDSYRQFNFGVTYIFYHHTYIHICMTYVLLTFLICLFLLSYKSILKPLVSFGTHTL